MASQRLPLVKCDREPLIQVTPKGPSFPFSPARADDESVVTPIQLVFIIASGVVASIAVNQFQCSSLTAIAIGLIVLYLPFYCDGAQYNIIRKSRYWPWFAHLSIWHRFAAYFPASIEHAYNFALNAQNGGQFVFAVHPHGAVTAAHMLFFTDCCGFLSKIAPLVRRDLGASVVYRIPLFREFCMFLGCVDAGAKTANSVLAQGVSMQLYPGGILEQVCSDSNQPLVAAKGRSGFIKLALSYDVPVVPVYVFGEDKVYTSLSAFGAFRVFVAKTLRVGLPLFYGRLDTLGIFPIRIPLVAVMGDPIWPIGIDEASQADIKQQRDASATSSSSSSSTSDRKSNKSDAAAGSFVNGVRTKRDVSKEEIAAFQLRYIAAITKLFDDNKKNHKGYENAVLEIISA